MAKILVVDDSAFLRNALSLIIESGGHQVVGHAENGCKAVELFKTLNPELVTLDYLMAGKNGAEVLEEIIEHDSNARVIMISGSSDAAISENALQRGAKAFLEKSFIARDILRVIDQVMLA